MLSTVHFLSVKEACDRLDLSLPTLKRRLDDGTIPHIRMGRRILIPAEALQRLQDKALQQEASR